MADQAENESDFRAYRRNHGTVDANLQATYEKGDQVTVKKSGRRHAWDGEVVDRIKHWDGWKYTVKDSEGNRVTNIDEDNLEPVDES